jgi:phosphate starvation-inducible PhoH-like protein
MSKKKSSRRAKGDAKFLEEALLQNGSAKRNGPKRKRWSIHDLKTIKPLTPSQQDLFHTWVNYDHICAHGTAGTGKTFLTFYLSLNEIFSPKTPQDKIIVVRSVVPTREIGFLPGDLAEKVSVYESPYKDICAELIGRESTYDDMKEAGLIQFMPTSFVRGLTWDHAIVIVEECQNMTFHEINSIVTRLGKDSRIVFTGDTNQTDLRPVECGMEKLLTVANNIETFAMVEFGHHDIVRSDIVKSWIIAAEAAA